MKLISFAVPCYNSQDYMRHCIDSLLIGGEDVEIIIVNDGSKDDTGKIADEYEKKYPTICKAIQKENGGHGSGVNAGVHNATGLFYKVVDSDDWLDGEAYKKLLKTIKEHVAADNLPDMYICNYVYEHSADNTQNVMGYTKQIPAGFFKWDDMKNFYFSHVMLMHSMIYNTAKLREHFVDLPEHTFYVDNIMAYVPLGYVKKPFYLDVDLYRYFIGRDGQSINIQTAMDRYVQQIRVMKIMAKAFTYKEIQSMPKGLRKYMWHDLHAIMLTTLMFCCGRVSKERKIAVKEMWKDIKAFDKKLYKKVKYGGFTFFAVILPWWIRSKVLMLGYKVVAKKEKLG